MRERERGGAYAESLGLTCAMSRALAPLPTHLCGEESDVLADPEARRQKVDRSLGASESAAAARRCDANPTVDAQAGVEAPGVNAQRQRDPEAQRVGRVMARHLVRCARREEFKAEEGSKGQ